MAQKLLEIQNVSKIFRIGGMLMGKKLVANDDISLSIDDGKPVILSIVGESGCGKSTLCKMILRLYMQFADDIAFLLAQGESEEKMLEAMIAKLRVYRTAIERVLVAPFGSIVLFDAKELQLLVQDIIKRRLRQRADALLAGE